MIKKIFLTVFVLTSFIYAQDLPDQLKDIRIINGTFLGNWERNYYGDRCPENLQIKWRHYLGKGKTVISTRLGERLWAGSGWTGQPLLIEEDTTVYLLQGAFDHNLKKIDTRDGTIVWQYSFDDVIKGTGTIWENRNARTTEESVVILQGSRRGFTKNLASRFVPSFRAISYYSGKELWRMDIKRTPSYSRDVDGSALVLNDTAYIGLENAMFVVFNPDLQYASRRDGMLQPQLYQELKLYTQQDIYRHGGNLVTESSPALLSNSIYITSGSGHVYGYDLSERKISWDYYTGSDMDGSPVITADSCLLVTIEKQYIKGPGGLLKLDPSAPKGKEVRWFFPTEDDSVITWEGGIIGTAAVNFRTKRLKMVNLCAVLAIDGYLYILRNSGIDSSRAPQPGPDGKTSYPLPELVFKYKVGPSISTPIFVGNKLVAATYKGLFLFEFDEDLNFNLRDKLAGISFESTPVAHDGRLYIGARNGYLYCFGSD